MIEFEYNFKGDKNKFLQTAQQVGDSIPKKVTLFNE